MAIHHKMFIGKTGALSIDADPTSFEFGGTAFPEDCEVTFSDDGYFVDFVKSETWITVTVKSGSSVDDSPCTFLVGVQNLASGQRSGTITFHLIPDGGAVADSVANVVVSVVQTVVS